MKQKNISVLLSLAIITSLILSPITTSAAATPKLSKSTQSAGNENTPIIDTGNVNTGTLSTPAPRTFNKDTCTVYGKIYTTDGLPVRTANNYNVVVDFFVSIEYQFAEGEGESEEYNIFAYTNEKDDTQAMWELLALFGLLW